MFTRVKHATFTFGATVAAYLVYCVVVGPWVEPSVKLAARRTTSARPVARARKLDHLFPPGSWELERPKVIETDEATLLFDEYKPLLKGQLELTRCTVIYYVAKDGGDGLPSSSDRRRPVVLRAPRGATLSFDGALDVISWQFGRLVEGRLNGEITIWSPASEPGRDDAVEVVTRDVRMAADKITTPHDVRFQYGSNTGSGRGLTIHLARAPRSSGAESGPSVGGVRLLELAHLDQMRLRMNDSGLFGRPASPASRSPAAGHGADGPDRAMPVVVRCRGPLRLDFEQQLITLEDHVDLVRHNSSGMIDQLLCQLLEIHFARGASPLAPGEPSGKLEPTRVIASGQPVVIRAASVGIETGAERIEYDCILRRVWLKDRNKVLFRDRQREVEARELRYGLGENGRLGELFADGPGTARGTFGEPARSWEVTWRDQVDMRRVEGAPVLSFHSQVRIMLIDSGAFHADTLHLYLNETTRPGGGDRVRIELDRLHALGNVTIDSHRLSGQVGEARLWFRSLADSPPGQPAPEGGMSASPPVRTPDTARLLGSSPVGLPAGTRQKFDLRADLVEALVLLGDEPVADRLALRGAIQLREIASGDSQPVSIRGDRFELLDGATPHPRGALVGQPAEVVGGGLVAHGERFHVYPGDNRLNIVGPGDLTLADPPPGQSGSPTRRPARISWKRHMEFDGQEARFEHEVVVHSTQPHRDGDARCVALGDALRALLNRRMDFQKTQSESAIELAEFSFDGWAFLELELTDGGGNRTLFEQMQVRDLLVNQVTGEVRGQGPGWLRGIHQGRDVLHEAAGRTEAPRSAAGLNFLRVDFERMLAGNLHHRQLEFLQGTRTLYGPVDSWDAALDHLREDQLPQQAVVLTCQRLAIAQRGESIGGEQVEMEANGNAYVQGSTFSATGNRISYVRAKDQLILEGDGRNRATLAYRKTVGAPHTHVNAGAIMYWPSTRQVKVLDLGPSDINISQLPSSRPRGPAPR